MNDQSVASRVVDTCVTARPLLSSARHSASTVSLRLNPITSAVAALLPDQAAAPPLTKQTKITT